MDRILIDSGLFGGGLALINTPRGVAMYNEALKGLGIEPTGLKTFQIDGIGWSPEISTEKGNRAYLTHGNANQIGIIVTPDQYRKPIHFPSNTFDRRIMRMFFEQSMREIADITATNCVQLDLEQDFTSYESWRDLLSVASVTVRASAGNLMNAVKHQRALEAAALEGTNLLFNDALRAQIITSAESGDIRRRRVEIPDLLFSVRGANFWSRAFEGAFVLRVGADNILVLENDTVFAQAEPDDSGSVYSINEPGDVLERLAEEDLIEINFGWLREHPDELETLWEMIVADFVCRAEPECDYISMIPARKKGIMHARRDSVPPEFHELERLMQSLRKNNKRPPEISKDLARLLLRPSKKVGKVYTEVLWMLLMRVQKDPLDILTFYTCDKEGFFSQFETWPLAKKRWAAEYVSKRYVPQMSQTTPQDEPEEDTKRPRKGPWGRTS